MDLTPKKTSAARPTATLPHTSPPLGSLRSSATNRCASAQPRPARPHPSRDPFEAPRQGDQTLRWFVRHQLNALHDQHRSFKPQPTKSQPSLDLFPPPKGDLQRPRSTLLPDGPSNLVPRSPCSLPVSHQLPTPRGRQSTEKSQTLRTGPAHLTRRADSELTTAKTATQPKPHNCPRSAHPRARFALAAMNKGLTE
jgi:hypothetical protein